jgi:hypothetical protein
MLYEFAWNELKSSVPKVDALFAKKLVDRAWTEIQDSRRWSFLCGETVITAPDAISAGTVSATKGSTTIILDATADAALVSAALPTNELVQRTLRIGANLYNIVAPYVFPNLTIEYGYNGPTASGLSYMIYKPYYLAPENFLSWVSVIDPYSPMTPFNLTTTKEELDAMDPQRGCLGQPYKVVQYRYEENLAGSNPPLLDRYRYELWPHPIAFRQYLALYQRAFVAFSAGLRQPRVIPDAMLMAKVRFYAYEWAMANKGKHPELKGTDWITLRKIASDEYEKALAKACRQDEEIFIQNFHRSYISMAGQQLGDQYYFDHAPFFGSGYGGY